MRLDSLAFLTADSHYFRFTGARNQPAADDGLTDCALVFKCHRE